MAKIKAFALGGLDERGKNLFIIEVNDDIFIFDCGSKYPEREALGVDTVIADFTYIKQNKDRVKGIFITKAADDCIGGLPYLLKELNNLTIYASHLAGFMIIEKLKKFKVNFNLEKIKIINFKDIIKFGSNEVEVFQTTSSIPGSFGYALRTLDGTIIYTGDYIFDSEAQNQFGMDLEHLSKIAQDKILLLLSESGYASRINFTAPNHKIRRWVENVFKENKGRLILGCYEQDLYKINEMLDLAVECDRNIVAFYGQTLNDILNEAKKVKYLNPNNKITIVPLEKAIAINKDTQQPIIFVTGSGERLYARLIKITTGDDQLLKINDNDIVILSNPPVPGNELSYAAVLDELARTNAKVISISDKQVWDIKASYEDIKLMVNIMKPQFFIPIKTLHKNFVNAAKAAIEAGVASNNVLIKDNGQIIEFNDGKLAPSQPDIPNRDVFVDGIGIGDIGAVVLNERKQLSREGAIIAGVTLDRKTKAIVSLIDIQMRGVIYITEESILISEMQKKIEEIIANHRKKENFELQDVKKEIKLALQQICRSETAKSPMILAIINEVLL